MVAAQNQAAAGPSADQVAQLGQELVRNSRMLHLLKTALLASSPRGLDWAAMALLIQLVRCGPRRQADLAELTHLDPSTVSRYAAQLVTRGLAERRPDPDDGRAVQLVATPDGMATFEAVLDQRNQFLLSALARWSGDDVATFTDLLSRFNDDLEAHRPAPGTGRHGAHQSAHPAEESA